uniref:Uncharacterized protein n=1 Tax=Physcomitrium patens TaxID=3218 RepID=A0A2K1KII5_PHYPA|nr:hypothetical protein PHYPA_007262 [Physcomitrium patens]
MRVKQSPLTRPHRRGIRREVVFVYTSCDPTNSSCSRCTQHAGRTRKIAGIRHSPRFNQQLLASALHRALQTWVLWDSLFSLCICFTFILVPRSGYVSLERLIR